MSLSSSRLFKSANPVAARIKKSKYYNNVVEYTAIVERFNRQMDANPHNYSAIQALQGVGCVSPLALGTNFEFSRILNSSYNNEFVLRIKGGDSIPFYVLNGENTGTLIVKSEADLEKFRVFAANHLKLMHKLGVTRVHVQPTALSVVSEEKVQETPRPGPTSALSPSVASTDSSTGSDTDASPVHTAVSVVTTATSPTPSNISTDSPSPRSLRA